MRIPNSRYRGDRDNDQAMTSMIDVVFLLLIFFVCASIGQVGELLIASDMVAASAAGEKTDQQEDPKDIVHIAIRVNADGTPFVVVNNGPDRFLKTGPRRFERSAEPKSLTDLLRQLAEVDPEQPVELDIADDVPSGDYTPVYTAAQTAGFTSISFAIESP